MKKMKRFVAVLLAGIMALAMLTACGGTGNGAATAEFEAKVEQAYMAKLNDAFSKELEGKELKNDDAIKNLAVKHIEEAAKKETLGYKDLWVNDETTQNWVMICYDVTGEGYVMSSYEADKAKTITPNQQNIDAFFTRAQMKKANAGKNAKLTALGVGVETIDGKTYVAIGFRVEG